MLILLASALFLLFGGSGNFEQYLLDIKKEAKAHIEDKERAKEVIKLSESLRDELSSLNKELSHMKEQFLDLHGVYDAEISDFESLIDAMMDVRTKGQKSILDTRESMHNQMSEAEWEGIFEISNP